MMEILKINWTMIKEMFIEIIGLIIFLVVAIPFIIILIIPAAALTYLNSKDNK